MALAHPLQTPPLESGDRLTREEFERRYQAMPHLKKAELIEGVVYVASPVRLDEHAEPHADLVTWLGNYRRATPGVRVGDNGSVRLDGLNVPQPDAFLFIPRELGGQAFRDEDGYLNGAPELVAEVAATSASYDLNVKMEAYRRSGVREYLVWRALDGCLQWFVLRGSDYEELQPGPDGILRSEAFPGLWLDPKALLTGDGGRLARVEAEGVASPEHQSFVDHLTTRGRANP